MGDFDINLAYQFVLITELPPVLYQPEGLLARARQGCKVRDGVLKIDLKINGQREVL